MILLLEINISSVIGDRYDFYSYTYIYNYSSNFTIIEIMLKYNYTSYYIEYTYIYKI